MIPKKCKNIEEWVQSSVSGSLERLRVPELYGLLLHCPGELLGKFGQKLYSGLRICKDQGLVRKIGISVYIPSELEAIMPRFNFDLIQAPFM